MSEFGTDGGQDRLQVAENLVVPEAKDFVSLSSKLLRSRRVITDSVGMLRSVDFHDELRFPAVEVGDEGSQPDLGLELEAFQTASAETTPEEIFGGRHVAAELPDTC